MVQVCVECYWQEREALQHFKRPPQAALNQLNTSTPSCPWWCHGPFTFKSLVFNYPCCQHVQECIFGFEEKLLTWNVMCSIPDDIWTFCSFLRSPHFKTEMLVICSKIIAPSLQICNWNLGDFSVLTLWIPWCCFGLPKLKKIWITQKNGYFPLKSWHVTLSLCGNYKHCIMFDYICL